MESLQTKLLNENIKNVLVDLAVNDDLPMDMTQLDSGVFTPCTTPLVDQLIDLQENGKDRIRVYAIDLNQVPDDMITSELSDQEFMDEAEAQGNVWSLQGFEKDFNKDNISSANMFIRIV